MRLWRLTERGVWLTPLLMAAALAVACSPVERQDAEPKTEDQLDPSSFANARWVQKPQGTVTGALRVLPKASDRSAEALFEDALTYAREMQSYALLIWHRDSLLLEHYFPSFDAELRSESASMHKSVLALALAAAIDRGLIEGADVPAATFLTEWRNDPRRAVTLRHLLTMSSGLEPLSVEGGAESPRFKFFTDGESARATVLSRPLAREPGKHFSYSNADSQTLGLILERASGLKYEAFLSEYLWRPIGAADAFVWYNESDGFPRTYTALLARPRDWLRLGLLLKDRGRLFDEQLISETALAELLSPSAVQDGYGWQIWLGRNRIPTRYYNEEQQGLNVAQSEPFLSDDWFFMDGIGGQRVYVSRKEELVIVRVGEMRMDWDDAQLPNRVVRALASRR
ncbi:MAG: serine hydrolase [Pseudomonadota bacterium]